MDNVPAHILRAFNAEEFYERSIRACSMQRELYSLAEWVNIKRAWEGGARADGWKCVTRTPTERPPTLEGVRIVFSAAEKK